MINNENSVAQSLQNNINNQVIVKMKNGRAISGLLSEESGNYTILLGIQKLPLDAERIARVVAN